MIQRRAGVRPFVHGDALKHETMVLVTLSMADRRLPHGTRLMQEILYLEEGYLVKTFSMRCKGCRRAHDFRLIMERAR